MLIIKSLGRELCIKENKTCICEHLIENMRVTEFELTAAEMESFGWIQNAEIQSNSRRVRIVTSLP